MFDTDIKKDKEVVSSLKKFAESNPDYNALSNNCTDFAACGIEAVSDSKIDLNPISLPLGLYNETSKLPDANIVKEPIIPNKSDDSKQGTNQNTNNDQQEDTNMKKGKKG